MTTEKKLFFRLLPSAISFRLYPRSLNQKTLMDIESLLEKYLADRLTPDEVPHFLAAMRQPASREVLYKLIDQRLQDKSAQGLSDPATVSEMFRLALQKAAQAEPAAPSASIIEMDVPSHRRLFRRLAVAALILLSIGAGGYLFWRSHTHSDLVNARQSVPVLAHDAAPGNNKAQLTLDDGRTITLDSAQNGVLASQTHTTVVKLDNGRIGYRADQAESPATVAFNILTTPRGGQYQLSLPDGSQVWLNAASSIRYPTAFIGKERRVTITGEAYFEITPDPSMPFIVDVSSSATDPKNDLQVQVLGTHFNVDAYTEDSSVNTTLLEGAVRVTRGASAQTLSPGQALLAHAQGRLQLVTDANVRKAIAWKNGRFLFQNDDITTITRQLSRWYDIDFQFEGTIADHYTGQISRQVNISRVLKMLEAAGGISFSVDGKVVRVSPAAR
jgi:ferric-dicitrate binding protein FerR (iron transport regulator)